MKTDTVNKGVELWRKAKEIIPGGNQLLSKRAEMFLPEQWPAYYKKAKGIEIWDLDGNHYYDMSIMGIGTCTLGYAHEEVNKAVQKAIDDGNMATLNCYEEVALAEKLIALHPWAEMVRFSRTGGEACAIAVRIARAFTKKEKIAFCGYHGWHDWYLAANLTDGKNLDAQLLPGLEPLGVPSGLQKSALPFQYGELGQLRDLVKKYPDQIGVIIMEVARHHKADVAFLNEVKKISREIGAVLIFDEVSSGFRMAVGGMHKLYAVEPDIVVLGKALGNGYPISAIVGKKNVMNAAQSTFISSSYWTERIGFVAALATIKIFEEKNVVDHIARMGEFLSAGLTKLFKKYSLKMEMEGLPSVPIIKIDEPDALAVKSLFTQEMLKKGFLASTVIYMSLAHTKELIDPYLKASDEVLGLMANAIKNKKVKDLLQGPVCHAGFKRLN